MANTVRFTSVPARSDKVLAPHCPSSVSSCAKFFPIRRSHRSIWPNTPSPKGSIRPTLPSATNRYKEFWKKRTPQILQIWTHLTKSWKIKPTKQIEARMAPARPRIHRLNLRNRPTTLPRNHNNRRMEHRERRHKTTVKPRHLSPRLKRTATTSSIDSNDFAYTFPHFSITRNGVFLFFSPNNTHNCSKLRE